MCCPTLENRDPYRRLNSVDLADLADLAAILLFEARSDREVINKRAALHTYTRI
jgi:hypothetical protein